MVENDVVQQSNGLLDTVKEHMHVGNLVDKVHESRHMLIDVALYGGIGFLGGFFIKRYSTVVILLTLMIIGLIIVQQVGLVQFVVDWVKVHEVFGIQAVNVTGDSLLLLIGEWIKSNSIIAASFIIGILMGLKIG